MNDWQLTKAAIPELNYNFVKTQLKNIFGDNSGKGSQKKPIIDLKLKFESVNETTHEEVLQASRYQSRYIPRSMF